MNLSEGRWDNLGVARTWKWARTTAEKAGVLARKRERGRLRMRKNRAVDPDSARARDRARSARPERREYIKAWKRAQHAESQTRRELQAKLRATKRLVDALNRAYQPKPDRRRKYHDGLTRYHRRQLISDHPGVAIAYVNCAYCGRLFVYRASIPTRFCCQSHAHRVGKRSWKPRGMTRRQIAERDGWKCHLCGELVPDRPYAAHPLDPTMDHLLPVSRGGTDHPSNLRLAHNKCNTDRGAALGSVHGA